jgi:hypothetical protein
MSESLLSCERRGCGHAAAGPGCAVTRGIIPDGREELREKEKEREKGEKDGWETARSEAGMITETVAEAVR